MAEAYPPAVKKTGRRLRALATSAMRALPEKQLMLPEGTVDYKRARNEHGVYCVPKKFEQRRVSQALLRGNVWEKATLTLMEAANPHGDIVHAGTFIGDFLPALSRSRRGDARIWAFEPNSENYRFAHITMLLNGLGNVTLTHAGLGSQTGAAVLSTSNREGVPSGGGSRIISNPARINDGRTTEAVNLVTIDEAIGADRQVALIQLDVEEYEQQALTGALSTIARCKPLLILENLPEADWFDHNLAPLGYSVAADQVNANHVVTA